MAVLIEGFCLVVRNSTLQDRYPGGRVEFVGKWLDASICGDKHVTRVGFMTLDGMESLVDQLLSAGFDKGDSSKEPDFVIVSQMHGLLSPCGWLDLGTQEEYVAGWQVGEDPGALVVPASWSPDKAMSYLSCKELGSEFERAGEADGVVAYRHRVSGMTRYRPNR